MLTPKGRIARTISLDSTTNLDFDPDPPPHDAESASDNVHTIKMEFHQAISDELSLPLVGSVTLLKVVGNSELQVAEELLQSVREIYLSCLKVAANEIASQIAKAYLLSSSDSLGIRRLISSSLSLVGLDDIAVVRQAPGGTIELMAQFGYINDLNDEELARLSENKRIDMLRSDLNLFGIRQYHSLSEDPLSVASASDTLPSASVYIASSFYSSDPTKKRSLSGLWIRGASQQRMISWEDIYLLHSVGQGISIITSVGSILTSRLIQLQKITHSNGSILASMASSLSQTLSELESLLLICQRNTEVPISGVISSLGLSARDHLSYVRLNIHQMQAKITLSLWLEREAGIHRDINLERFNVLDSIHDIMSYAPALVESWASNYSGSAVPYLNMPDRRSRQNFYVQSRRDIFEFALLNLLENAVKYRSSDTPKLECSIEHSRDPNTLEATVSICLEDDGVGIGREDARHIFQSGWRPNKHKRSDIPGHGLGLFQTRELLNLVGADVTLISGSNPTKFCITIPIRQRGR